MLYLFLFFSFDIQPAEADSLQTIYFQLSPGHSVAVRHRCSNFPLDSILSHMHIETALKKKKKKTSSGGEIVLRTAIIMSMQLSKHAPHKPHLNLSPR